MAVLSNYLFQSGQSHFGGLADIALLAGIDPGGFRNSQKKPAPAIEVARAGPGGARVSGNGSHDPAAPPHGVGSSKGQKAKPAPVLTPAYPCVSTVPLNLNTARPSFDDAE
ncbi:hypothetical protein GCM10010989_09960 [Croceicoccus pelagius]|uniref:Uncharacterized protein n=1 Tax=Croceicoccus pelagius TaxID=1703341 RepID=A0A916YB72_9SPHN|nr:hypothetical protein GCM10010989_09960 [Croceicoccus pelagius]